MPIKVPSPKTALQKDSPFIAWCDNVIKISMYVLVFAIPVFFMPWTYGAGDFSKQALLVALSFIAFSAWMFKVILKGKFTVKFHSIHIIVGALILVTGLSTVFSLAKSASFWGAGQVLAQSFVSVVAYALAYFLISNTFSRKDIETAFSVLGISGALVLLYGILQMLGLYAIPLATTQSNSFNTIGSLGSLGFFAAVLLPLWIISAIRAITWWRVLYIANIVLTFAVLLLINYHFVWIVAAAASLLLVVCWALRRDIFDSRWMFLPIFFLVVSLFFALLSPRLAWLPQNPLEVSLSSKANMEINFRALQKFEVLGSGPGNFAYDFAKYKNSDFNQSPLWNVNFTSGASRVLTGFTEIGIVGLLVLLVLLAMPVFYGAKHLFFKNGAPESETAYVLAAVFVVLTAQVFGYFFYNANIALDFVYFFALASLTALIPAKNREYALKSSPMVTLATIFIFTMVFIFGAGVLFIGSQRYVADMQYHKALVLFSQNKKDESLQYLKRAAMLGNLDLYFNQLALFSLVRAQDYSANQEQESAKQAIQSLIVDAISASGASVSANPNNYENWSLRGYICQNLLGLSREALGCAIEAYDKALALSPASAYVLLQQGNTYLAEAVNTANQAVKKDLIAKAHGKFSGALALKPNYVAVYLQQGLAFRAEGKAADLAIALQNAEKYSTADASLSVQVGFIYYQDKNWLKAQDNFLRALALVPRYANALYYSGLTYEKQGQKDNALAQFSKLLELNVKKEDIQKIIDNVRAGNPALDGLAANPPVPVENPSAPEAKP